MDQISLKRIGTWGRFLGITTMIFGIISAISGLFAFIVGAIPGAITAWLGYILYKTGSDARAFAVSQDERDLQQLLAGYGRYLLVQSILMIVLIVFIFLIFLIFGLSIFALFGGM